MSRQQLKARMIIKVLNLKTKYDLEELQIQDKIHIHGGKKSFNKEKYYGTTRKQVQRVGAKGKNIQLEIQFIT